MTGILVAIIVALVIALSVAVAGVYRLRSLLDVKGILIARWTSDCQQLRSLNRDLVLNNEREVSVFKAKIADLERMNESIEQRLSGDIATCKAVISAREATIEHQKRTIREQGIKNDELTGKLESVSMLCRATVPGIEQG